MPKENILGDVKKLYDNGITCDVLPVSARKYTNIAKLEAYSFAAVSQVLVIISESLFLAL